MYKATLLALIGMIAVAKTANTFDIPADAWASASPKESAVKLQLYGKRLASTAS